jgi:hypothetical protein
MDAGSQSFALVSSFLYLQLVTKAVSSHILQIVKLAKRGMVRVDNRAIGPRHLASNSNNELIYLLRVLQDMLLNGLSNGQDAVEYLTLIALGYFIT